MIGVILVMVLFVALVTTGIVLAVLAAKRRRQRMEALAAKHGWTLRRKDRSHHEPWAGTSPFDFGHARRSDWIFEGTVEGRPFSVFQYICQTTSHNGKSSSEQIHNFRVCILEMPMAGHGLRIVKEHLGHKLFDALGGEDIDFESDAFSRRFWVKCDDRRFAYDVITPKMMSYLMPHTKWTWQWVGHHLILHQAGSLKAEQVESMLRLAQGFASRLPRHRLATP